MNPRNGAVIVMERIADPFEPARTTMRLRPEAQVALGIPRELCFTLRDRKVTSLEHPPT